MPVTAPAIRQWASPTIAEASRASLFSRLPDSGCRRSRCALRHGRDRSGPFRTPCRSISASRSARVRQGDTSSSLSPRARWRQRRHSCLECQRCHSARTAPSLATDSIWSDLQIYQRSTFAGSMIVDVLRAGEMPPCVHRRRIPGRPSHVLLPGWHTS